MSAVYTQSIILDMTPPSTLDNVNSGWVNTGEVLVTLNAFDAHSVAQTLYCVDTAGTCTPTTSGSTVSVTCAP